MGRTRSGSPKWQQCEVCRGCSHPTARPELEGPLRRHLTRVLGRLAWLRATGLAPLHGTACVSSRRAAGFPRAGVGSAMPFMTEPETSRGITPSCHSPLVTQEFSVGGDHTGPCGSLQTILRLVPIPSTHHELGTGKTNDADTALTPNGYSPQTKQNATTRTLSPKSFPTLLSRLLQLLRKGESCLLRNWI